MNFMKWLSAGVRRIEAICSLEVVKFANNLKNEIYKINEALKSKDALSSINKLKDEIKTIKTDEINIKVDSKNISSKPKMETFDTTVSRSEVITKVEYKDSYLNLIIGFILGILSCFIVLKFRKKDVKKELPIEILIKKAKSDKELFDILLPYAKKDEFVDEILLKLEENLYKGFKHNIDKKKLIEALQRYFYISE